MYCQNVVCLNLLWNNIKVLAPLIDVEFPELKELAIDNNKITDINFYQKLNLKN